MRLTNEGFHLRNRLAEIGIEVTPNQLEDAAIEAAERICAGPGGRCRGCGRDDVDMRYGWCFACCVAAEAVLTERAEQP